MSITRSQVIALALNIGNDGNFGRLVSGSALWKKITKGKQLTRAEIITLVQETLTTEELIAVQEVWDTFGALQPEVMAQAKRLTGRTPDLVKPSPITLASADGQILNLRGGCYPIVYDRKVGTDGGRGKNNRPRACGRFRIFLRLPQWQKFRGVTTCPP